ncbi:hypothetical protein GC170_01370 [bacterium]|nr:hypothetical protein [bacterium]
MTVNVADAPWVQAVNVPPPRTFGTNQAISFVLKFDERVNVDPDAVIPVEVGIGRREAAYVSGSGTRSIVFRMLVTDNDIDTDGIRLGRKDDTTGFYDFDFGGSVRSLGGQAASDAIPRVRTGHLKVDGTGPQIVEIGDFVTHGNRLSVVAQFDRPVAVRNSGDAQAAALPTIKATVDGQEVELRYVRGSNGNRPSRLARFVYMADRNLNGAEVALVGEPARAIQVPGESVVRDAFGNALDYDLTRSGEIVIDGKHRPVEVTGGSSVTVTETGRVSGDLVTEKGVIYGNGDLITVVNDGVIDTVLGNNAPAVFIEGSFAKVTNNGEMHLGGNNSPGIEIRGDDAVVENAGYIHSEVVGLAAAADEPGRDLGNNEGISVVGDRSKVTVIGRFEGRAGNAEYVSMSGDDLTLIAAASAETFGVQSEIFSISGLKSSDPAHRFTASVQGEYKTHEQESEFISITALGGTLNVNANFESVGNDSEGISISGGDIVSTIAGSISTLGENSEGVSLSALPDGTGGNLTSTISAEILTGGKKAEGISITAQGSTLNVSSDITTRGENSEGISVTGNGITLNMTGGSISTSGYDSEGISITGLGVSMTSANIDGDIQTSAADSEGISFSGVSIVSRTTGKIVTAGVGSEGISIIGNDIYVEIDGSVVTTGSGAPGILIDGNNITVLITGSISTSGPDSPGILVAGGSNITINRGLNTSVTAAQSEKLSNPKGVTIGGDWSPDV